MFRFSCFLFLTGCFVKVLFSLSESKLQIQNVDTSNYPEIKVDFFVEGVRLSSLKEIEIADIKIHQNGWLVPNFALEKNELVATEKHVFLLLDASRSLSVKDFGIQIKMVKHFLRTLDTYSKVTIISFHDTIQEHCKDLSPHKAILDCLGRVVQRGNDTLLYDAIYGVIQTIKKIERGIPYIFIFTDGNDEGSLTTLNDNLAILEDEGTPLFLLGMNKKRTFQKFAYSLKTLGSSVIVIDRSEYLDVLESIFRLLENRFYTLTFKGLTSSIMSHVPNNTVLIKINNIHFQAEDQENFFINHLSWSQKAWYFWQRSGYLIILWFFFLLVLYFLVSVFYLKKCFGVSKYFNFQKQKMKKERDLETKISYLEGYDPKKSHIFSHGKFIGEQRKIITDSVEVPFYQGKQEGKPIKKRLILKGDAELVLIGGDESIQHRYILAGTLITIGLGRENNIVLTADGVSYKHAEIKHVDDSFVLFDLISTGGVYLNGRKIFRPRILSDLDTIRLGSCEFCFQIII